MNLTVRRRQSSTKGTIGQLAIDGVIYCYTLEDPVREIAGTPVGQWKIAGDTAIPKGKYKVVVDWSKRFSKFMPHLLEVPGFAGIRIHSGNTDADTEGCILVGQTVAGMEVLESHAAFGPLLDKISEAIKSGEEVWIEVDSFPVPVDVDGEISGAGG